LLGNQEDFLTTWETYRHYFGSDPSKQEFFPDRHLLADIPAMAHTLRHGSSTDYRRLLRELRWRRATGGAYPDIPWWAILLLLWGLLSIVRAAIDTQ
jgi:hypothetical protein